MTKEKLLAILLEYQQFTPVDEVMSAFPSNRLMSFFKLDINASLRDSDKYTTLHFAAVFGHKQLIKTLANHHQIKFDVRDSNGDTPLHLVAKGRLDDVGMLSTLIDADKSHKVDYQNDQGRTPLYYAVTKRHHNLTRLLLEHKASITIQDKFGNTPLHAAVISGDIEILKTVLLFSQNGIIKNNKDMTPLEVAVYMNSVEAFNLLLPYSNDSQVLFNAALLAIKQGNLSVLEKLSNIPGLLAFIAKENNFKTLAKCALQYGQLKILDFLHKNNPDLIESDKDIMRFIKHPNAGYIEKILSTMLIHGERNNDVIYSLIDSFPELTFEATALIFAAKQLKIDSKFSIVLLHGTDEFGKLLKKLQEVIGNDNANLSIRFVILEPHWRCGEIKITKGCPQILYIDSLGEKSIGGYMKLDFNEIATYLPSAEVFLSIEKRQRGWTECRVFSVDDLLHLINADKYLSDKYEKEGIFSYVRDHIVKIKIHKFFDNDSSYENVNTSHEINDALKVYVVKLPLRFLRTIQSLKGSGSNDNFFFDAGFYPRLAVSDQDELNRPVNKRMLTVEQSVAEHVEPSPSGPVNKRLEYELDKMRENLLEFLLTIDSSELEKLIESMSLKYFMMNFEKLMSSSDSKNMDLDKTIVEKKI